MRVVGVACPLGTEPDSCYGSVCDPTLNEPNISFNSRHQGNRMLFRRPERGLEALSAPCWLSNVTYMFRLWGRSWRGCRHWCPCRLRHGHQCAVTHETCITLKPEGCHTLGRAESRGTI